MNAPALPKIIAVVGPTATGKTALGVLLAVRFDGEIVSGDAKQLYRGMDVGTAKERYLPVPQYLIDTVNPGERVSVGEYQQMAYGVIDSCLQRKIVPVLVGGSGLYVESVLEGYLFGGAGSRSKSPRYQSLRLALAVERDVLRQRIAERLDSRTDALIQEISGLLADGVSPDWLLGCGLEYRAFTLLIQGAITLSEAREQTLQGNYAYVKRQYTWWRRDASVKWVPGHGEALELATAFLNR